MTDRATSSERTISNGHPSVKLDDWSGTPSPLDLDRLSRAGRGEADSGDPRVVAVGSDGQPRLSEWQRGRWGFVPGEEFEVTETPEGILLRRADPPLMKVYVEPTSRCNLNCRTCVRHSWNEPLGVMSDETYDRLIAGLRAVPTLRTVAFWGFGEPLLHPSIARMIAAANALGAETEMITNGLLLDAERSRALIDSGLDRLIVSVDGATPSAHGDVRDGASLDAVIANVEELNRQKLESGRTTPEIGVEFVIMRSNVGELPKLRALASRLEARFIVLTNVLPYTPDLVPEMLYGMRAGRSYPQKSRWSPEVRLPRLEARGELLEPLSQFIAQGEVLDLQRGAVSEKPGHCRFIDEGSAVISWDGQLSPCIGLMHSFTVYPHGREKRVRRYALGSVAEAPIGELWANAELRAFRRRVRDFSFSPCSDCGACEMAERNEEDCFGNTFPTCGDCLWSRGVILCP